MHHIFFLLTLLFFSGIEAFAEKAFETDTPDYAYLDTLALSLDPKRTSGKSSNWHNYTEVYALYFAPIRKRPLKFLEIGIYKGAGVRLWENYFENAELHFIDITFDHAEYFSTRSHYHLADQAKPSDLQRVIDVVGGNFDIIIDDGGHTMEQQLVSFKELFPYLNSGGLYIIEDLHTSYWSEYGGGGTLSHPKAGEGTTIDFLKNLIDDLNFVGARTLAANHRSNLEAIRGELTNLREEIFSMHFYDSLCVIIKR